jgi:hypothetical protein
MAVNVYFYVKSNTSVVSDTSHTIDHAVIYRLLTAVLCFRAQVRPCGTCCERSGPGRGFLPVLLFPLSVSSHRCCTFTHVSSGGWTDGPVWGRSFSENSLLPPPPSAEVFWSSVNVSRLTKDYHFHRRVLVGIYIMRWLYRRAGACTAPFGCVAYVTSQCGSFWTVPPAGSPRSDGTYLFPLRYIRYLFQKPAASQTACQTISPLPQCTSVAHCQSPHQRD